MDLEGGDRTPTRCDSSLSVVKIAPATRSKKSSIPFVAQKFSDPEMESLYHLHSKHRKKTELFQTFLYAVILYCIVQIAIKSCWIAQKNMNSVEEPSSTSGAGEPQYLKSGPANMEGEVLRRVIRDLQAIENPAAMLRQISAKESAVKLENVKNYARNPEALARPQQMGQHQFPRVKRDQRDLYGLSDRFGDEERSSSSSMSAKGEIVYTATSFALLAITTIIAIYMLLKIGPFKSNPHIPAILWLVTILLPIVVRNDNTLPLRIGLDWILLENFLIWVVLPIRLKTAVCYSIVLAASHTCVVLWKGNNQEYLAYQIGANLILLLTTDLLGVLAFYLDDKKQRRAFLDTRQSLEMKLVIEEQAKEQEQLLLSVLPEHLAIKMRQDMGAAVDGQFKTVYMARHENVSILYADIVGFTAISSTYSASELVKILNELFARFDKLAEKYHQLRIKILGDCYYCICGAPEERDDHAVLAVHMGLSMVAAIKYVRESTKSPVDMRVGVHTGAILAGVLGQRQWQFDVYSKDVELANKMESSGMPGRVHISEKTLSYLHGEFEVELAHGEKREEILRLAGLKTYFIVKILIPLKEESKKKNNAENNVDEIEKDIPTFAEESSTALEENHTARKDSNMEAYRKRLKEELISRDGYRDLSAQSKHFGLRFRDNAMEAQFNNNKEPYAGISSISSPVALTAFSLASFMVISFNVLSFLMAILGILILLMISVMSASESSKIKSGAKKSAGLLGTLLSLDDKLWIRRLLAIVTILLLTLANGIYTIPCLEEGRVCSNYTYDFDNDYDRVEVPLALPTTPKLHNPNCHFPAYLVIFCSFFLFAVTLLPQPGFWVKFLLLTSVVAAHGSLINLPPLRTTMECSETFSFRGQDIIREHWQLFGFILAILVILAVLNRRLEKSSRVLFLWKNEVELQRERAAQLRQKNEALVYNILPPHVAAHFLGTRKRKHDELYSQSYSEVGILFASMPNFSDFYTEESVNNQGLECLRFLNEVISDFDSLLDVPRFAESIIKIKTISSTYMAASGLNPSKQANADDPIKIRWAHLSLLVEFAFELKRTLTGINEQSFNHFVLKMGINHGPAVAGVIGVKKPHYDIWGDTVNVASRMESTGKAGYIQVTEKTQKILCIYGYKFEQRGLVNVKGKGQLMTYYLVGRGHELSDYEIEKIMQAEAAQNAEQSSGQTS